MKELKTWQKVLLGSVFFVGSLLPGAIFALILVLLTANLALAATVFVFIGGYLPYVVVNVLRDAWNTPLIELMESTRTRND